MFRISERLRGSYRQTQSLPSDPRKYVRDRLVDQPTYRDVFLSHNKPPQLVPHVQLSPE